MAASDTIFALSSGHGRAGVAVIRLSGPAAQTVVDRMAAPRPRPRYASLRHVKHPDTAEVLDEALVLWLPGPKSETGEDMAELHVHGGRAVIQGVLEAIAEIAGCRLAEPGEFARRAFEHGKLDLTGAEGLADLIDAETAAQRRQALKQAAGALQRLYDGWRLRMLRAMALLEAAIDFSDEASVWRYAAPGSGRGRGAARADQPPSGGRASRRADQGRVSGRAGRPPNVGKSTLLNALAQRDVAIVSAEAGTTRDVLEVKLDLGGLPILVSDTAGIRETRGNVEQEGIRRALARAQPPTWCCGWSTPRPSMRRRRSFRCASTGCWWWSPSSTSSTARRAAPARRRGRRLGAHRDRPRPADPPDCGAHAHAHRHRRGPALTQARHRQHLLRCRAALNAFVTSPLNEIELRAEDLRRAAQSLGRITGAVDVEDVLGEIFGRFCIGK